MIDPVRCPGCGLAGPDEAGPTHPYMRASPCCWRIYGEVLAREYNDPAYMAVHQLTVDAYAAQHPGEDDRRAAQSVWVHLTSLYLQLELSLPPHKARETMKKLAASKDFRRLDRPVSPQWMRTDDVHGAADAAEHRLLVKRWARSVWDAWHGSHAVIRQAAPADS